MSTLPKHLRESWRYLAVRIAGQPTSSIERSSFQRQVHFTAQNLLGDVGSARADLQVLEFTFADGQGHAVVRTKPGEIQRTRAILACIHTVTGDPIALRVTGVSGTVRACEEKYLGGPPEETAQRTVAFSGAERSAVIRGDRVDIRTDEGVVGATDLDVE